MSKRHFGNIFEKAGGKEDGPDGNMIRATIGRTGACLMGKRMFEEGEPNWLENLFKSDVYVLTNEKRDPWVQKGNTTFYFMNDGITSAFEKAKLSTRGKDLRVMGGAETIQQFLNAELVDEFILHISPVILARGIRLFEHIDKDKFEFEITDVIQSPLTKHHYYQVTNK